LILRAANGDLLPMLATDWEYDSTNTVLTMTIRDDVEFTDGSPLTADVVKQNLERFRDNKGVDSSALAAVQNVEAPDDTTVILTLDAPNPALLGDLARDAGVVASGESLSSPDIATNPVGSGPYILDLANTVTDSTYVYKKNPDYWNPDLQHYDKLVINTYADPTAALNAIKAGDANGVLLASNNDLAQVEEAGWTIHANELNFSGLLLFDREGSINEALGDVRVRQAINMALDRDALLEAIGSGYGTATEQIFPATSVGFDEELDSTYKYDPDGAKDLLTEAGYPDGFTLEMPTTAVLGSSAFALIGQQLADIGITVNYSDLGGGGPYVEGMLGAKYSAAFMQLSQDSDWKISQFIIAPGAVWNPFRVADDTIEDLLSKIQFGDEEAVHELNAYIVEQAWFAPMYRVQGSFATDAATTVEMMTTNSFPAIYDFQPTP